MQLMPIPNRGSTGSIIVHVHALIPIRRAVFGLYLRRDNSRSLRALQHRCDGGLETLNAGPRRPGLPPGILRVYTIEAAGAASQTLRPGPVAFGLLLAAGSACFARPQGAPLRARSAGLSSIFLNSSVCHGGFMMCRQAVTTSPMSNYPAASTIITLSPRP